ncbi:hypothetical protein [Salicibibacter kimchii]|nr:hypothetical protein [Salicibibacter kimchii]
MMSAVSIFGANGVETVIAKFLFGFLGALVILFLDHLKQFDNDGDVK